MKISTLIQNLENIQQIHGDLDVWCFNMDKYGYAYDEDEFELFLETKGDLSISHEDKDTVIVFIGKPI